MIIFILALVDKESVEAAVDGQPRHAPDEDRHWRWHDGSDAVREPDDQGGGEESDRHLQAPFPADGLLGGALGEAQAMEEGEQIGVGSDDERSAPRVVSGTVQGGEEVDGEESKYHRLHP